LRRFLCHIFQPAFVNRGTIQSIDLPLQIAGWISTKPGLRIACVGSLGDSEPFHGDKHRVKLGEIVPMHEQALMRDPSNARRIEITGLWRHRNPAEICCTGRIAKVPASERL
jgi:hypothetical protein